MSFLEVLHPHNRSLLPTFPNAFVPSKKEGNLSPSPCQHQANHDLAVEVTWPPVSREFQARCDTGEAHSHLHVGGMVSFQELSILPALTPSPRFGKIEIAKAYAELTMCQALS